MRTVDAVLGVGWLAFGVVWVVAALGAKAGRATPRRYFGIRLAIAVVVVALLRTHVLHGRATHSPVLAVTGVVLFGLGLAVAVWARAHLGRNWGTPMSQKQQPELVTTGPYRWIRNPIYSGIVLAMVGTAIAVNVLLLVVVALVTGYFVYSAVVEERFLSATFSEQYAAYKQATKMLIPFVF